VPTDPGGDGVSLKLRQPRETPARRLLPINGPYTLALPARGRLAPRCFPELCDLIWFRETGPALAHPTPSFAVDPPDLLPSLEA